MIMKCKCDHDYQDKKYGKGMRVHNPKKVQGTQAPQYRCSVCGDVKTK